jgi:uncharacterized protein
MSQRLHPLPIPELRGHSEGLCWPIDQPISGLESLSPVRGQLWARHHGTALELRCRVETILTLRCDRCLQHYNHPLKSDAQELLQLVSSPADEGLELPDSLPPELGPDGEDLDERLDPEGTLDPERWLFEQLSLQLPLVNRCGPHCPGPDRWSSDESLQDPRWSALADLLPPGG